MNLFNEQCIIGASFFNFYDFKIKQITELKSNFFNLRSICREFKKFYFNFFKNFLKKKIEKVTVLLNQLKVILQIGLDFLKNDAKVNCL